MPYFAVLVAGVVDDSNVYGETLTQPDRSALALDDDERPELILDPSILLSATGLDIVASVLAEEPSRVFVSGAFVRLVQEGWEATQPLLDHFLADGDEPIDARSFDRLYGLVRSDRILAYAADADFAEGNAVAQQLARIDQPVELREILIDEWVFLQSHSWIGARARKTFDWFKKAGAEIIEYSTKAWNRVREVAAHEIPALLASERTHHLAKWVAAAALGEGAAWGLISMGLPVPRELTAPLVTGIVERRLLALFDP